MSQTNRTDRIRALISAVFLLAAGLFFIYSGDLAETAFSQARRPHTAIPQSSNRYRQFPHDVKAHRMECNNCHKFPSPNWNKVRTGDAAFPDITEYPKHESCIGCHRQQFFKGAQPSFARSATSNPSPRDSRRLPVPEPARIVRPGFKGKIDRRTFHLFPARQTHRHRDRRLSTAARFQERFVRTETADRGKLFGLPQTLQPAGRLRRGVRDKTAGRPRRGLLAEERNIQNDPIGHTTCFTCHSQDSGIEPAPTNSAACHKLKPPQPPADFDPKLAARMGVNDRVTLDLWRRRRFGRQVPARMDQSRRTKLFDLPQRDRDE